MFKRQFTAFLGLLAITNNVMAGLPPTTMKGQSDASKSVTFNLQVPKSQATRVNATTALIETGNKNYIADPGVESGTVGSWTAVGCATLTNAFPACNGSGAAAFSSSNGGRAKGANTTNPAVVSSGQLAGSYSLNFATSGAGTAGDMYVSQAYAVDTADLGHVLQIKAAYKLISGTVDMSGTATNTFGLAIYDLANNAWIQPAGVFNFVQGSGSGTYTGTFQVPSNMTSFQVAVYNPTAPGGAVSLYLDDFYVGPQPFAMGPAMSDPVVYNTTYTGLGTIASSIVTRQQIGKLLRIQLDFTMGTGTAVSAKFALPSGLSVDTTIFGSTVTLSGKWSASATPFSGGFMSYSADPTNIYFTNDAANFQAGVNGNTWAAGTSFSGWVEVPISGWSSNTAQSADSDNRVISFRGSTTATTSFTNAASVIVPATIVYDDAGAWNTNTFTCPATKKYSVKALVSGGATASAVNGYIQLNLWKNGAYDHTISARIFETTATTYKGIGGATEVFCKSGETLSLYVLNQSGATFTADGVAAENWIAIEGLSGSTVVQATETTSARYYSSSTGISGSLATVTFATKDWDDHGAYSGGVFNVYSPGKYQVNSCLQLNATYSVNQNATISIYGGASAGTQKSQNITFAYGSNTVLLACISDVISAITGDQIAIKASSSGTTPSIGASNFNNYFSVVRVGN